MLQSNFAVDRFAKIGEDLVRALRYRRGRSGASAVSAVTADEAVWDDVERRVEHVIALVRLLVLAALAAVYWLVGGVAQNYTGILPLCGLAATTLAGLAFARYRAFRPWMLWVGATVDLILLVGCLAMFTIKAGRPLPLALETPAASVIFVFLAIAGLRQRPLLVLYTGALFVVSWLGVWWLPPLVAGGARTAEVLTPGLARLAVVALATFALSIGVSRARRALIGSIKEARLRASLSRYSSPQMVEELAEAESLPWRAQRAAVLFADLRDFTAMAEAMPPADLAEFLNAYRSRVVEVIRWHNGMVDKFIGDGVMAIFGVPRPGPEDAREAVLAGVALVSSIRRWSEERVAHGLTPVRIGVGVHCGDVIAGSLGDEQRLEYTAVGDTVNVAARIEQLTAALGASLLASEDAVAAVPDLLSRMEELPMWSLRGRSKPIRLYRLRDAACGWTAQPPETSAALAKIG